MNRRRSGGAAAKPSETPVRKPLLAALDRLPVAFALFDARRRLAAWNAPLVSLGLFPKSILKHGVAFAEFQRRDSGLKRRSSGPHDVKMPDGKRLEASRKRVPPGHLLLTYENVTGIRAAEADAAEALERQRATADILKVISGSPAELKPVFHAILANALSLCGAHLGILNLREGDLFRGATQLGGSAEFDKWFAGRGAFKPEYVLARMLKERQPVQVADMRETPAYKERKPVTTKVVKLGRARTFLVVPLLKDGEVTGNIAIYRSEVRPFTQRQIELVRTFADQAVIAIENVRLFNETKEALEQQTATAEILNVISSSPTDVQPVFDAMAASAARLCEAYDIVIFRAEGDVLRVGGHYGPLPLENLPMMRGVPIGRAAIEGKVIHVLDVQSEDREFPVGAEVTRRLGVRTVLSVPLLRGGQAIGVIAARRSEARYFTERQIDLLKTFADQAVIAIENVRLFNETKEGLERQTATSEVLKAISRAAFDLNAVLQVLIENATRLADANQGFIFRYDGEIARLAYAHNAPPAYRELIASIEFRAGRGSLVARTLDERCPVHIADALADPEFTLHEAQRSGGFRSMLGVPMMRDGNLIGVIAMWKTEVRPFTEKQIELVSTFADQAVIAIENVRLFNEIKEALDRQTATAEILRVISSSPTDIQPVLDAVCNSAARLCEASDVLIRRLDGQVLRAVAHIGPIPLPDEVVAPVLSRDHIAGRAVIERRTIHIHDVTHPDVQKEYPAALSLAQKGKGFRSLLIVPLVRHDQAIGLIGVRRIEKRPFSDQQISLLQSFADQAVIAIENVRLFNETKEALERQTATAEILKVIASSPTDVQPVFDVIVERAVKLCGARFGRVYRYDGSIVQMVAGHGLSTPGLQAVQRVFPRPAAEDTIVGRVILARQPFFLKDIRQDATVPVLSRQMIEALNTRSQVTIPMLRAGEPIGAITMGWDAPDGFDDRQVALLRTFADQAVIAIENVRLFNETKEALERQTATAEILKVIASSPSDVQPVFDAIVTSGARVFGRRAVLRLAEEGQLRRRALSDPAPGTLQGSEAIPIDQDSLAGRVYLAGKPMQVFDTLAPDAPPFAQKHARTWNFRSNAAAPLLLDGKAIGLISVNSPEPGALSDKQMEQLQTFADQAVIAIQNVRLFNETKESLERQTATAEILKVIASSPSDVQPVFDAIVDSVSRLFGRKSALRTVEPEGLRRRARSYEPTPGEFHGPDVEPLDRKSIVGLAILERRALQWSDTLVEGAATYGMEKAKSLAFRSIASAPLIREGNAIGVISVSSPEPGALSDKQMELLSTFADQAVIAIENVRLFNETKEALERQTATAEILKVIASSPSDVQPVFGAIVQSAVRLFEPCNAGLWMVEGDRLFHRALAKSDKAPTPIDTAALQRLFPRRLADSYSFGVAIEKRRVVEMQETEVAGAPHEALEISRALGTRSVVMVPLLREGSAIGLIALASPYPGMKLAPEQIALLRTFADQAVIAIENVRLFNETKEALERQTATAEILKVIASSPSDVQPVFDAIAASARRLLDGHAALVARRAGDMLELAAFTSTGEAGDSELSRLWPSKITGKGHMGKALLGAAPAWVEDIETDPSYSEEFRVGARARGMRSAVSVPMLREGEAVGVISVNRSIPGRFSDHQTSLLETFADQALIAIENVRLFNETQEALARQEAAAQVLRAISESVSDTAPVFAAILECCNRLIPSIDYVQVQLIEGPDRVRLVDHRFGQVRGAAPGKQEERKAELMAREAAHFPRPLAGSTLERALSQGRVVMLADVLDGPDTPPATLVEARRWGHSYSQITVPLMREGRCIGAIEAFRRQLGGFAAKESSLLESFADQAVIAIANVRLFNETNEALERQTATAEVLRVISSSPTDVQPVFDVIVRSCQRLFDGYTVALALVIGNQIVPRAGVDNTGAPLNLSLISPWPLDRGSATGASVLDNRAINLADLSQVDEAFPRMKDLALRLGYRSGLWVPLRRESGAIGGISILRRATGAFTEPEVSLAQTFADQAVIAIENVRLFRELETRTEALTKSVGQLTALGEVGQAISGTLDLDTVLKTIVSRAVQLAGLDAGVIYEYDPLNDVFVLRASESFDESGVDEFRGANIRRGEGAVGRSVETREPVQVMDTHAPDYPAHLRELLDRAGYRALLAVPLLREEHIVGALMVIRRTPGEFAPEIVELLRTFAGQSALAIQNARLFREIAEKGKQLEEASRHKSQFLASMSHELRTPLNAILGFNEMILGDIYGEVPADMKEPLTDIQTSGKHLLRLINNVLDLAKIEAGRMELAIDEYSVHDTVEGVRATLRPLAEAKGLELAVDVPPDIPLARGDGGRITQCLMNLAGNSLKFTKQGSVGITVALENGTLTYRVKDTGIGIPADKIGSLFTEFKQTDATIASEYGGTGLGLSITKKFIEMHGGRIWAESEPGSGSTFIFEVPLRAGEANEA